MRIWETTLEYCIAHGHQDFFLGYVETDDDEQLGDVALHCPACHTEHLDNPSKYTHDP
jgi:hypothetical protein